METSASVRGTMHPLDPVDRLIAELRRAGSDPLGYARLFLESLEAEAVVLVRKRRKRIVVHGAWRADEEVKEASVTTAVDWDFDVTDDQAIAERAAALIGAGSFATWSAGRARTEPFVFAIHGGAALQDLNITASVVDVLLANEVNALSHCATTLQLERARVASALHETVAQDLTTLTMQLDVLEELSKEQPARATLVSADVRASARNALRAVREAVAELTPAGPSKSLERKVHAVLNSFEGDLETTIEVNAKFNDAPDEVSTLVVGFLRESLTNLRKHAGGRGRVRVVNDNDELRIIVRSEVEGGKVLLQPGHGLDVMRSFARLLGGDVSVSRGRGTTTEVTLSVPV